MSRLSPAQRLARVNIVLITVLSLLLVFCLVSGLWFPAAMFALLTFSNVVQFVTRRRSVDHPDAE